MQVLWSEAAQSYHTIGFIEFPPQNSFSQERRVFREDRMILDPWRGLAALGPLDSQSPADNAS